MDMMDLCPQCEGLGFLLVLVTPYGEDEDSLQDCDFCNGMGVIKYSEDPNEL